MSQDVTPHNGVDRFLQRLCDISATIGGIVLVAIASVTVVSVVGRAFFSHPILGDVELVQLGCAVVVASFLPYTQFRRGNIIVDFFTTKASAATNARLDRLGALVLAVCMGLLAWRSGIGGVNAWNTGAGSMMLGFPEWIVYAFMVPPMVLSSLIALHQALFGFGQDDAEDNPELAV